MMQEVIDIASLSVGYPSLKEGGSFVCKNINVKAYSGELIALVGPNGAGKSTLLKTIIKFQKPISGKIFINQTPVEKIHRIDFARLVSFVSTEQLRLGNISVYELVALGRFPYTNWLGSLTDDDKQIISESITGVGIGHLLHKLVSEISDGERQRAMIARALAQDTQIIILDEPTAFLDLPNKFELVHLLSKLAREHSKTIIFSTHDLNIAIAEADKIWLMAHGKVSEGAPEDLILQGVFTDLFDNRLFFDMQNGIFKSLKLPVNQIYIKGNDDLVYKWTINAIERIGFQVSNNEEFEKSICFEKTDGPIIWKVKFNGVEKEFYDIYSVVYFLKNYNL